MFDGPVKPIITGEGSKAFVAGLDIAEMAGMTPEAESFPATTEGLFAGGVSGVTIAAINGYALGGGNELASLRRQIAAGNARFGQPE